MRSISQLATMAAIVATLAYLPVGALIALAVWLLGGSPHGLITFAGALHVALGLFAWWLFAFAGACAYAACVFPWHEKEFAWPSRK